MNCEEKSKCKSQKHRSVGRLVRIVVYTCRVHRDEFPDAEILETFGGHRCIMQTAVRYYIQTTHARL